MCSHESRVRAELELDEWAHLCSLSPGRGDLSRAEESDDSRAVLRRNLYSSDSAHAAPPWEHSSDPVSVVWGTQIPRNVRQVQLFHKVIFTQTIQPSSITALHNKVTPLCRIASGSFAHPGTGAAQSVNRDKQIFLDCMRGLIRNFLDVRG